MAATGVLSMVGASLVFDMVIVNVCVAVAPAVSSACTVTDCVPTWALRGVPLRTPVLASKDSHVGRVLVTDRVMPSFASTSDATTVYVYNESSSTAITAVLSIVGASLVFATVMVNVCVTVTWLSVTVSVTSLPEVPTLAFSGVPDRTPVAALKVSQLGTSVEPIVSVSPSTSEATSVYVYTASSVAVMIAVLSMVGASLVGATTIVNDCVVVAVPSVAVMSTE